MSRRKGEVAGHINEREFPHLVELELPPGGFRSQNLEFDAFHREHGIPIRRGRGRHEVEQFHVRFCFPDAPTADAFRKRFGGMGLLGTTLRYPYEVRKAEDYFCDLPDLTIAPEMLRLAEHILDSKAAEFDPATFRDRYEEALLAHLKAKQAGAGPERRKTFAPPHRVVNLMEALRRSVAEDTKPAAPRKGAAIAPARKRA